MATPKHESTSQQDVCADLIFTLSMVLDYDENQKLYHAWRVAALTFEAAKAIGYPSPSKLYYAGLLHDIGAVGIKDHICHLSPSANPAPEIMAHSSRSAMIFESIPCLRGEKDFVADHHERYDGTGYPRKLRGDDVSVEASLIWMADFLEVSLRRVKAKERSNLAKKIVRSQSGRGCRPDVAEAFKTSLQNNPDLIDDLYDEDRLLDLLKAIHPPINSPTGSPIDSSVRSSGRDVVTQLLWAFARVIDAKHTYTRGHSERVAFYAYRIARALNKPRPFLMDILWAGFMHDVGKVGTPRNLLDKPGSLSSGEMSIVQQHANRTLEIVTGMEMLGRLAYPAAAHHERFDGSGYPLGRAREDIPLIGRILAYADAYDAMTSSRSYRRGLDHDEALRRIKANVGSQFDPALAETACDVFDKINAGKKKANQSIQRYLRILVPTSRTFNAAIPSGTSPGADHA